MVFHVHIGLTQSTVAQPVPSPSVGVAVAHASLAYFPAATTATTTIGESQSKSNWNRESRRWKAWIWGSNVGGSVIPRNGNSISVTFKAKIHFLAHADALSPFPSATLWAPRRNMEAMAGNISFSLPLKASQRASQPTSWWALAISSLLTPSTLLLLLLLLL